MEKEQTEILDKQNNKNDQKDLNQLPRSKPIIINDRDIM